MSMRKKKSAKTLLTLLCCFIDRQERFAQSVEESGCPLPKCFAFCDGTHIPGNRQDNLYTYLLQWFQYNLLQCVDLSGTRGYGSVDITENTVSNGNLELYSEIF